MCRRRVWALCSTLNLRAAFKTVYYRSHHWKSSALLFLVFTLLSLLRRACHPVYKCSTSSNSKVRAPRDAVSPLVLFDQEYVEAMRTERVATQGTLSGPGAEHVELFQALLSTEKTGLYVDIGANEGVLLTLAATLGHPTIGVEAISQNYIKLLNIIKENGFQKNVRVVHAAASNISGKVVGFKENMNPNSSQRNGQQVSSGETFYGDEILQYTTTVVLDDLVDADITLLKLDVEGTEFLALMGAKRLFCQRIVRYIHFEFSPSNMESLSGKHSPLEFLTFLHDHNYSIYIEDCSHDISAEAIAELPAKCAKQNDAEYAIKFQNRQRSSIESYKLQAGDFSVFLETMLKHSSTGSMLVNLLAILH